MVQGLPLEQGTGNLSNRPFILPSPGQEALRGSKHVGVRFMEHLGGKCLVSYRVVTAPW